MSYNYRTIIPSIIELEHPTYNLELITAQSGDKLYHLCTQALGEMAIMSEFSATVRGYAESISAAQQRTEKFYAQTPSEDRLGYLITSRKNCVPVGMYYLGIYDRVIFSYDGPKIDLAGINFSAWLLQSARKDGVVNAIGDTISDIGRSLSDEGDETTNPWYGKTIYTGIKPSNIASESSARKLDYIPVGYFVDNPAYRAWLRLNEWKTAFAKQQQA